MRMQTTDRLSPSRIEAALADRGFWPQLVYRDRVGSTNDLGKELASQGAPDGTIVVAEEQTAGRGRFDRRWIAPARASLLCSILFRPDLSPDQAQRLTMLCSLAAAEAVEEASGLQAAIKWPNDLVVGSSDCRRAPENWRKLGGILTEVGVTGSQVDYAVVGIGINVNVPASSLSDLALDATSLLAEVGEKIDRTTLLIALLEKAAGRYEALRSGQSPREEWAARLATLGRRIQVSTEVGTWAGVAEAVDEDGALLLRTPEGVLLRLLAGDTTLSQV